MDKEDEKAREIVPNTSVDTYARQAVQDRIAQALKDAKAEGKAEEWERISKVIMTIELDRDDPRSYREQVTAAIRGEDD